LEALRGIKTAAQIARERQVHPLLVGQWKATLRERMPELFERDRPAPDDSDKLIAQLHQKIGQLTVDLDWLKKKCKQLGLSLHDER
jgi:transposase-like protein